MGDYFSATAHLRKGRKGDPEVRFWNKVEKHGPVLRPELGACWIWKKGYDGRGYGCFNLDGRTAKAHRLSWEYSNGRKPLLDILHRCDNPPCVNPAHLFEGDALDNAKDMIAKGRANKAQGEGHPKAKLTKNQVMAIRTEAAEGIPEKGITTKYGISRGALWAIVVRKNWKHI